jgi:hypothetical protein
LENYIEGHNGEYEAFNNECTVVKYFRFEDNTDPFNQSILRNISSDKYKLKGVLVHGYGIYSDAMANYMMDKLKTH